MDETDESVRWAESRQSHRMEDTECLREDVDNVDQLDSRTASSGKLSDILRDEDDDSLRTSEHFTSVPSGLQLKATYDHTSKNAEIMGVAYNGRMRKFLILDAKGITSWKKDAVSHKVSTALNYPKYEYRVMTYLVYVKKYNVYFTLTKDFSVKVLNQDFEETCSVHADLRSVLFLLFNPVTDELITGGVGGTKVWTFLQTLDKTWEDLKPMSNYRLMLKYELPSVGGSWVKKVELDLHLQHLYCCSDTDLHCYDMNGQLVFKFERAHAMSITGCAFSREARLLVTSSIDTDVKVWSLAGGLVHTFRGHSRPVSSLLLHPQSSAIVITCSLDGSVRMSSLYTMEMFYSVNVSSDGLVWMGLTDDKLLYLSTLRTVSVWSLNQVIDFWAMARSKLLRLSLVSAETKSTRVLAVGEDNSVRLFSRATRKNLCTVLPPPRLSPFANFKCVTYNRAHSVVYTLMNFREIWIYTARTDPATRLAVWDALQIQSQCIRDAHKADSRRDLTADKGKRSDAAVLDGARSRATVSGFGNEGISGCCCVSFLESPVMVWTEEGFCCPLQLTYLLFGLEDGRILFMDPIVRGKKYFEFRASKDPILAIEHDRTHECLITKCNLGHYYQIQIWSLPKLDLLNEVNCPTDLTGFSHLGANLVTSHSSGQVILHKLLPQDQATSSVIKSQDHVDDFSCSGNAKKTKPDHQSPVVALDKCSQLGIFCTCSSDGAIKIWEDDKVLLTEIALDESPSAACFLNNRGDLLVGYTNHVFIIDHTKVCPSREVSSENEELCEVESDIYEDPAVTYETIKRSSDPVTLRNYLVPFNVPVSEDFLKGRQPSLPSHTEEATMEEIEESEASAVPTEVYLSPNQTPRRLSLIDMTLTSKATKYDLDQQLTTKSSVSFLDQDDGEVQDIYKFEMPHFGISPGPTPSPSTPSSIATPSSCEVSEGGESTDVQSEQEEETDDKSFRPVEAATETSLSILCEESTPAPSVEEPKPIKPAKAVTKPAAVSRLSVIRIDAQSLMKEDAKKQAKLAVHSHVASKEASRLQEEQVPEFQRPARTIQKKEFATHRKLPKSGEKKPALIGTTTIEFEPHGKPKSSRVKSAKKGKKSINITKRSSKSLSVQHSVGRPSSSKSQSKVTGSKRHLATDSKQRLTSQKVTSIPSVGSSPTQEQKHPLDQDKGGPSGIKDDAPDEHETEIIIQPNDEETRMRVLASSVSPTFDVLTPAAKSEDISSSPDREFDVITGDVIGRAQIKKGFDRSVSPSIYSDHGSEWTTVGVEDSVHARLENIIEDMNNEERIQFLHDLQRQKGGRQRPATSVPSTSVPAQARPNTPADQHETEIIIQPNDEETRMRVLASSVSPTFDVLTPAAKSEDISSSPDREFDVITGDVIGRAQIKKGFDRSVSPSIYSDHGSEWTTVGVEDSVHARLESIIEDMNNEERIQFLHDLQRQKGGRQRPSTSVPATSVPAQARPNTPADGIQRAGRPATAHHIPDRKDDLVDIYEEALKVYQNIVGTVESQNNLYKNDGINFGENWHERMIERHRLLALHRQMRVQSASEKRQLLMMRKQQKRQSLLGHRSCDTPGGLSVRADPMVQAVLYRQGLATPLVRKEPAVTHPAHSRTPVSHARPHTASTMGHASHTSPTVERKSICSEIPFRSSLSCDVSQHTRNNRQTATPVDIEVKQMDPRSPASRLFRAASGSKSIPSKCTRYVLVRHPRDQSRQIIPTPLEEQLIEDRFPNWKDRWLESPNARSPRSRPLPQTIVTKTPVQPVPPKISSNISVPIH